MMSEIDKYVSVSHYETEGRIMAWCHNVFNLDRFPPLHVAGHTLNVLTRYEPYKKGFIVYREYYNEYDYEGRGSDTIDDLAFWLYKPTIETAKSFLFECVVRLSDRE